VVGAAAKTAPQHPALEQAAPLLEALLTGVPGDQFLEIRTIAKGGASQKNFYPIDSLRKQGIASALPLYLDGRENVYYGVAPRYEKREAKAAHDRGDAVNRAAAVWFDEITKAPPALPPFSWLVETSIGKVQGGYFLTAPTAELERVERLNKRLGAAVGGDNVWNRGRILRLPGFINAKYEGQQRSYLVEFRPERRYTLEELERLLPPLPPLSAREDAEVRSRTYDGPFHPHYGEPLPDDAQERFSDYLKELGLTRTPDGRYRGPCPFPHQNGPSDGEAAFYGSPVSGTWHCFGSGHEGARSGGAQAFRALGFRVQLPDPLPDRGLPGFVGFPEDDDVAFRVEGEITFYHKCDKPSSKRKRDNTRPSNLWDFCCETFPDPPGIKPRVKSHILYSESEGQGLVCDLRSPTWQNGANAAFKKRKFLYHGTRKLSAFDTLYVKNIPVDDWTEEFHDTKKRAVERAEGQFLAVDNQLSRGCWRYLSTVPLDGFDPLGDLSGWLVSALSGIRVPDSVPQGQRFHPIRGSHALTKGCDAPVDEDKGRYRVVAQSREKTDWVLVEAELRVAGRVYEELDPVYRTQYRRGIRFAADSLEEVQEFALGLGGYELRKQHRKSEGWAEAEVK
jgi:hypothetical protein